MMSRPAADAMEDRLKSLCLGNSPERRREGVQEAKRQGRKVIGILCSYVPEEVIYAAGMLPWRVTGTWDSDISRALVYRDADTCKYCSHVLESLLRGELDSLDGVIASDWDDDRRRLYDLWCYTAKAPFTAIISAPRAGSRLAQQYFAQEMRKLAVALQGAGGSQVTEGSLWEAIEVYDRMRTLLREVYEMRKLPNPPLTGAEMLGLTTAAMVMEPAHFNSELAALLPYIQGRDPRPGAGRPRIMVSSDMLDNPAYLELVESEGCSVVMDDLDTGSRHIWRGADTSAEDPSMALAMGYCTGPACPPALNWRAQGEQIVTWAQEYGVDGVIELSDEFSPARQWRAPVLRQQLASAGIPHLQASRGYALEATGGLRTRVAAFLEMISQQSDS